MSAPVVLAGSALVVVAAVALDRFNRKLEAACALPMHTVEHTAPSFKRIPLPLELVYVGYSLAATLARTLRKALA